MYLWGYFKSAIGVMLNFRSGFRFGLVLACTPGNPRFRTAIIISIPEFNFFSTFPACCHVASLPVLPGLITDWSDS